MSHSRAEHGFRTVQHDLGLRPAFHPIELRGVGAHVCLTIPAYPILRSILYRLEPQGDTRSRRTLRRVCYATVDIPLEDGSVHRIRIRKPGRPEACRWDIYRKLGIPAMTSRPKTHSVLTPKPRKKSTKSVVTRKNAP